jgi:hypothetical protein
MNGYYRENEQEQIISKKIFDKLAKLKKRNIFVKD